MDAVTYPDPLVKQEFDRHWLTLRVDVSSRKAVADLFGVLVIPTVVAVTADGRVLGHQRGFQGPEEFAGTLRDLRSKH